MSIFSPEDYLTKIKAIKEKAQPLNRAFRAYVDDRPIPRTAWIPIIWFGMGGFLAGTFFLFLLAWALMPHLRTISDLWYPFLIALGISSTLIFFYLRGYVLGFRKFKQDEIDRSPVIKQAVSKDDFSLFLGESTGQFYRLWHSASVKPDQNVFLGLKDAVQNILTLGAIGSGKTSRVMRPLLLQLLSQGCGGLIFDIKGDVKEVAQKFADLTTDKPHKLKKLKIIGVNQSRINLLAGLTPEIAASFLQSAFLLNQSGKLDGFWLQTASELCRNSLGVLLHFPEYYNLESLYAYIFDKSFKDAVDGRVYQLLPTLDAGKQRILKSYCRYDESIFSAFDEKVKSGVKATVAQVLSPFSHPVLIDAFCTSDEATLDIQDVLDGTIYLVDLPLATWGFGGKVIYTFIKLRFFNLMQNRQAHPDWNQDRPVFFMCDEYQEIVSANKDGLSDLNFWDKARTSNTIGIISAQAVSSFEAAIGDTKLAEALLQNFRQKICFKTEDVMTLRLLDEIAGDAITLKETTSYTRAHAHSSSTSTTTEQREAVITSQLLRQLMPNQCVALLSINGQNVDDVLNVLAVNFKN